MDDLTTWFFSRSIPQNAEIAVPGFPDVEYELDGERSLDSVVTCRTFSELAQQLGVVIFDAALDENNMATLATWLSQRLDGPSLTISEAVSLYKRKRSA